MHVSCHASSSYQESQDPTYSKMWSVMESDKKEVLMGSNQKGVEKVLSESGKYAFFMESTSIEYQVERNDCKLQQIGGTLDSKSYGIAMPQGGWQGCQVHKVKKQEARPDVASI